MISKSSRTAQQIKGFGKALGAGAVLGLLFGAASVRADDPVTMAPPDQSSYSQVDDQYANTDGQFANEDTGNASQDSVFNWTEVPQNQPVPIRRAVFDRGGYQLYDNSGETIVVPFASNNLYVMKFGESRDGSTYFENAGDVPVLYIPKGGYLENASVPGTRWYPFPKEFNYEEPVYVGIAPSYPEFLDMGWYPDESYYGSYYSHRSFIEGGIFLPTIGLSFFIGGHSYHGWNGYHNYGYDHPAPFHLNIVNNRFYHADRDRHSGFYDRPFVGSGHPYFANHDFGSRGSFGGGNHTYVNNSRTFGGGSSGHNYYAHRNFQGDGNSGDHGFSGGGERTFSNDRSGGFGGGTHSFQGGRSWSGGDQPSSGGGQRSYGGRSSDGSQPLFSSRSSSGSRPSFSDGEGRSYSGGGGGRSSGSSGGRSYNGGGGRSSGGGSSHSSGDGGGDHGDSGGGRSSGDGGGDHGGHR